MNANRKVLHFVGDYYFFLLLIVLALGRLVYVIPNFPKGGVDPSWAYGFAVATFEHLVYGKDIVCTFGPLSAVQTGFWMPAGYTLTVGLSIILSCLLSVLTFKIFSDSHYFIKFLVILFFFITIKVPTTFVRNNIAPTEFFIILIPTFASLWLLKSYGKSRYGMAGVSGIVTLGFIGAVLLLVKMSYGVPAFLDILLLFVFYVIKKDTKFCLILLLSFISCFVFWLSHIFCVIEDSCHTPFY